MIQFYKIGHQKMVFTLKKEKNIVFRSLLSLLNRLRIVWCRQVVTLFQELIELLTLPHCCSHIVLAFYIIHGGKNKLPPAQTLESEAAYKANYMPSQKITSS